MMQMAKRHDPIMGKDVRICMWLTSSAMRVMTFAPLKRFLLLNSHVTILCPALCVCISLTNAFRPWKRVAICSKLFTATYVPLLLSVLFISPC
ncbi:hypothetical protein IW261DRAFT_139366 [Armillaria novae-zelandiae]|uniref:Uncharacterized protein n=1 Tax=Armillaria novae-zelandiae TaxID=153914 RepID=A0AA39ND45_9AGAR|nr:hypothetical protein IW261DRAFT_139366 [Armillaria novae-zelandiae]